MIYLDKDLIDEFPNFKRRMLEKMYLQRCQRGTSWKKCSNAYLVKKALSQIGNWLVTKDRSHLSDAANFLGMIYENDKRRRDAVRKR